MGTKVCRLIINHKEPQYKILGKKKGLKEKEEELIASQNNISGFNKGNNKGEASFFNTKERDG